MTGHETGYREARCILTKRNKDAEVQSGEFAITGTAILARDAKRCDADGVKRAIEDALAKAAARCDRKYDCLGRCHGRNVCLMGAELISQRTIGLVSTRKGQKYCKVKIVYRCRCECVEPSYELPVNLPPAKPKSSPKSPWDFWPSKR